MIYRHMIQYPRTAPETPHLTIVVGYVAVAGIDVSGVPEKDRDQFGDAVVRALQDAEQRGRETLQEELRNLLGAAKPIE